MGRENITRLNNIKSPSLWDSQITELSEENHISRLALFTNLVINKKISPNFYGGIRKSLEKKNEEMRMESEKEKQRQKALGIKPGGRPSKSIHSELEKAIYRNAFFEGVVEEYEVLNHFKIKEIDRFVYE